MSKKKTKEPTIRYKKDGTEYKKTMVEPIRSRVKMEEFGEALLKKNKKYYVMWRIGVTSGLRISDILNIRVIDVKRNLIDIYEKKTKKRRVFKLNSKTKKLCEEFIEEMDLKDNDFLVYSNKKTNGKQKSISRQQAYDVLRDTGEELGIDNVGSHTCRKSFGFWHYQQYKDVAVLQEIFNHSAPSITLRYIGITADIINKSIEELDI